LSCSINSGLWDSPASKQLGKEIIETVQDQDLDRYYESQYSNIKFSLGLFEDGFLQLNAEDTDLDLQF